MPFTPEQNAIKAKITPLFDKARYDIAAGGDYRECINGLFEPVRRIIAPNYRLEDYRLCLPVDVNGGKTGLAAYVDPLAPPAFTAPFFKVTPDSIIFTCPDSGARTKFAKYCRSELQMQGDFSVTEYSRHPFKFLVRSDGTRMGDGIKMVNAQFHCGEFPMMKLAMRRTKVGFTMYALVKDVAEAGAPDTAVPIADAVPFDVIQDLVVEFFPATDVLPQHLRFTVEEAPLAFVEMNYPLHLRFSPHCGVYMQSNKGVGDVATVEFPL